MTNTMSNGQTVAKNLAKVARASGWHATKPFARADGTTKITFSRLYDGRDMESADVTVTADGAFTAKIVTKRFGKFDGGVVDVHALLTC